MELYIGLAILFLLVSACAAERASVGNRVLPQKYINKSYLFISVFVLTVLWFLTAFRSISIGNDTASYVRIYNNIVNNGVSSKTRIEVGFQAYCYVLSLFKVDARWFIIITASLFYFLLIYYIIKYSNNYAFSAVLAFCFTYSIFASMIRQDFAMIIVLYAYQLIKKDRKIKALLLICLAITFHNTAAAAFLFFFNWRKVKYNRVIVLVLFTIVLCISGAVSLIILKVLNVFGWDYYALYFSGKYASSGWLAVFVDVFRALAFLSIIHEAYIDKDNIETRMAMNNSVYLCLFCSIGFALNLFTRFADYFILITIVEIPNAITN